MIPLLLCAAAAVPFGPMGPDAPAREPQMVADSSIVAMAFGAGNAIYFSSSRDGGTTFAPPTKVARAGIVPLSRHRGPRIALSGRVIVITAVAGDRPQEGAHAHGLPSDGDLLVWRSQDGGRTWSFAKPVNDVSGSASEGLHALASDGHGTLFAVWLDQRGGESSRLYTSRSTDGGSTWSRNVQISQPPGGSVCACCHPSAAISPGGELTVMWRGSLNGSRDPYLATSRDGVNFSAPRKLGDGTWPLNACPMDGGGLAVSESRVVTAWRREAGVFLDEPGRPERQIGTGKDVALALSGDRPYVAWVEGANVDVWTDGEVQQLSSAGAFPSLAALPGGGVLAAWEENGAVQIRRLP